MHASRRKNAPLPGNLRRKAQRRGPSAGSTRRFLCLAPGVLPRAQHTHSHQLLGRSLAWIGRRLHRSLGIYRWLSRRRRLRRGGLRHGRHRLRLRFGLFRRRRRRRGRRPRLRLLRRFDRFRGRWAGSRRSWGAGGRRSWTGGRCLPCQPGNQHRQPDDEQQKRNPTKYPGKGRPFALFGAGGDNGLLLVREL
jgi:hypothetical protein